MITRHGCKDVSCEQLADQSVELLGYKTSDIALSVSDLASYFGEPHVTSNENKQIGSVALSRCLAISVRLAFLASVGSHMPGDRVSCECKWRCFVTRSNRCWFE